MSTGISAKCDYCGDVTVNPDTDSGVHGYPHGAQIGACDENGELDWTKDLCTACYARVSEVLHKIQKEAAHRANRAKCLPEK